jgi:Chs5-Arf1p-binding protein BUD7/BCH1
VENRVCFVLVWLSAKWSIDKDSSYNAFSKVDMRVSMKIPGGIESYAIDDRGNKIEATSKYWLETYMSSVLRAIHFGDEEGPLLTGHARLNPLTGVEAETRFLEVASKLFFHGNYC